MSGHPNALAAESSPYLQQHADNPVEWYPWGEEALRRAREEQKPILLSIGYSACHWCHVMAHESFEDAATAAVMNECFINIKVDREERPDLDKIYQTAHQLLTGRAGGWPLTMFLTHDEQIPFFGGTYFPREPRHGLPAFTKVMNEVAGFYRDRRGEIHDQGAPLLDALKRITLPPDHSSGIGVTIQTLQRAHETLLNSFEPNHGGFGRAPKFPHCTSLERLLRHYSATGDEEALERCSFTLRKMALGGIHDQLGGGFCRYSVDNQWMIPHFEKMLYDNGPLLALYSQAWQITGEPLFRRTAELCGEWVMREMQAPEGGYYATLDADSEGYEGTFYLWHPETVRELLGEEHYALVARHFGLDRPANFEGAWHLHVYVEEAALASEFMLEPEELARRLAEARAILFAAREQRVHPGRDEKILTAWNGLMIRGMAIAGRALGRGDFIASAERAVDFIRDRLWCDGRLSASYKDGVARLTGYLDDYAFLLDALLELLQARWSDRDLAFAIELAETLLARFEDRAHGGFYFTADDHEALIQRPKPLADESTPSGNGIAAYALSRLGRLLGEARYLAAAQRTLNAAAAFINEAPHMHNTLLIEAEGSVYPSQMVILRGSREALAEWQQLLDRRYEPRRQGFAIPNEVGELPGALGKYAPRNGFTAYLCSGMACSAPITAEGALASLKLQFELPS